MFGISFSEIILIFFIALLVFGPRQLPIIVSKLGKFIYNIRSIYHNLRNQIYHESGIDNIAEIKENILTTYHSIHDRMSTPLGYNHIQHNTTAHEECLPLELNYDKFSNKEDFRDDYTDPYLPYLYNDLLNKEDISCIQNCEGNKYKYDLYHTEKCASDQLIQLEFDFDKLPELFEEDVNG